LAVFSELKENHPRPLLWERRGVRNPATDGEGSLKSGHWQAQEPLEATMRYPDTSRASVSGRKKSEDRSLKSEL